MNARPSQRTGENGVYQHLLDSLKGSARRYRKQVERCQARFSEEAVHDLRVEIRRVLALVELIGVFAAQRPVKKARKLLKAHLDVFGELRDTQVQTLRVGAMAGRSAGARSYRKHLRLREARCVRKVRKAVKSFRPARVRKLLEGFREEIRARREQGLETADWTRVRHAILRAFGEVARLNQRVKAPDTRTIHRTRIAFKKYRYMIESLAAWLAEASPEQRQAMHDHQTLMGDVQDLEVLMAGVNRFLHKRKHGTDAVRAFRDHLVVQRQRAVAGFLKKSNRLSNFAPQHFLKTSRAGG